MHNFQMNKQSWRKRSMSADLTAGLPIFNPTSTTGRRESQSCTSKSSMSYKLIHLIPVVVMLCFFILWCFSTLVELESKDGRTRFVPISKDKKVEEESETTDVGLTVLVLESPPDGFMAFSEGPDASLGFGNQSMTNVSLLDVHNDNVLVMDSYEQKELVSVSKEGKTPFSGLVELDAAFSVGREPSALLSDAHEPKELFSDSHEPKASFSVSDEVKHLFPVSHESGISYPSTSNEAAPQSSGEG